MQLTIGRRRRRLYAVLFAGAAVAATLVCPQAASAYTLATRGNCTSVTWESPPRYVVHLIEFFSGGPDYSDSAALFRAIEDVSVEFNQVGESSAEVSFAGNNQSMTPFEFGNWYDDAVPTLHIGFTDDPAVALGGAAAVQLGPVDANCQYDEAHMVIMDLDHLAWNLGTPEDSGEDYYTAEGSDASGAVWFRPAFLHELLHAFGLAHSDDTYAFMNNNDFAWANRPETEAIRPLPDDIRALRSLYPGGGGRAEVAVLNTWYTPGVVSGSAVAQRNCAPSLGDTDSTLTYARLCGTGGPDSGSTDVCPGDVLRTRYSMANYSTSEVTLSARVYFSPDDVYNSGLDTLSVTSHPSTALPAAHSHHRSPAWQVPNVTTFDADYHVIVRISGTTTAGVPVSDWIPLTGTVHVRPANQC